MKKFIVLLALLPSLLFSVTLSSYSTDEKIDIADICNYASQFKVQKQEQRDEEVEILWDSEEPSSIKQDSIHQSNWIMVELDENLSSGSYWIEHTAFDFKEHSFKPHQNLEKFSFLGRKYLSFYYIKTEDQRRYFLKATPSQSHVTPIATLYTPQTFSTWIDKYSLKILISFFLFGLIFMAAIYNGALYLYNREKSFLYYTLMQLFMIVVLIYQTDIIETYVIGHIEYEEIAIFFYFIIVEVVILFILFFIRSFLETKKYLPFHDKILRYITVFAVVDLVLFFFPIMLIFKLYTFILLYTIWVAWLRLKQGYKPALFFIFGWFALMAGVFISDFFPEKLLFFDPILVGSTIEAFFLAIAISYKMREIRNEKEEQQELLVHQSRLASMGEMLGSIAHQWRQPLARLGYIFMNIESQDTHKHHTKKLKEASAQLEFMSQTIDDFRNFYVPNRAKEYFSLAHESQKVVDFIAFDKIELKLIVIKDIEIMNHKNEYKQVLLNLLSNAEDVLLERKIDTPQVTIEIDALCVRVSDNAGGVKIDDTKKIFEPYFTTKKRGLGIGLYMSKMIVETSLGGHIGILNDKNGATFYINF